MKKYGDYNFTDGREFKLKDGTHIYVGGRHGPWLRHACKYNAVVWSPGGVNHELIYGKTLRELCGKIRVLIAEKTPGYKETVDRIKMKPKPDWTGEITVERPGFSAIIKAVVP